MNTDRYPFGALSQGTTLLADAITLHARFPVRNEVPASAPPSRATAAPRKAAPLERKGWLNRLDTWFWRQRQSAREAYLAQAKDVFEVERRIRDLERNIGSRYY
jgi:hypothetical protein